MNRLETPTPDSVDGGHLDREINTLEKQVLNTINLDWRSLTFLSPGLSKSMLVFNKNQFQSF